MGGEDFSRFWLADKSIESLIFWVGGVAQGQVGRGRRRRRQAALAAQPFWAPDAETVISTATEAMTLAALDVLKKG